MRRNATEVSTGDTVQTDVCIIGGGVAGLTIARELAGLDLRVCVVESGGTQLDEATQALAEGDVIGDPTNLPVTTRRRQLGGSANIWDSHLSAEQVGFRCAPLEAVDFERREYIPDSGWPISKADLDPYYARAQAVCGLGPYAYDAHAWADAKAPVFEAVEQIVATSVWQFGRQELFIRHYPAELDAAGNITILLHATVTEIESNESGTAVSGVRVATLAGNAFRVAAGTVILAAGGLDNARLLLLSDRVQRNGLGNDHDLVGRYFMEHPFIRAGTLAPFDRQVFDRAALYDVTSRKGTVVMAKPSLTEAVLRRERLLNSCMLLMPAHGTHKPESIDALKVLVKSGLRGEVPERAGRHVRDVVRGLDFVGVSILRKVTRNKKLFPFIDWGPGITEGAGWSSLADKPRRFSVFDAYLLTEQPPLRRNRVLLGDGRDQLGCRKLLLDWRWDDQSRQSILRTERLMADAFRRSGFGRLRILLDAGQPVLLYPAQHHHLGTTRMHSDPKQGVVDPHGRVHGLANLFVAGGSLFPTGGYINPTLTIVALALRLADHLRSRVK